MTNNGLSNKIVTSKVVEKRQEIDNEESQHKAQRETKQTRNLIIADSNRKYLIDDVNTKTSEWSQIDNIYTVEALEGLVKEGGLELLQPFDHVYILQGTNKGEDDLITAQRLMDIATYIFKETKEKTLPVIIQLPQWDHH